MTSPDWVGRVIDGRYRIASPLAEGGMGMVFVAEHLALKKEVALKVIHSSQADKQEALLRFAREAVTTANLEHPHIVPAYDYGELPEGGAYLVMQLVRGTTLRDLIDGGHRFTWREACDIAAQVSDAVAHAHARGVVHRDLKPSNILVEFQHGTPFARVTDFGIARLLEGAAPAEEEGSAVELDHTGLTRVGVVVGTPGYMSPEQATGEAVDERTDIYALGVVLWETITRELPFDGDTFLEVLGKQLASAPVYPRKKAPTPPRLRRLLTGMIALDKAARPPSAEALKTTLTHLARMGALVEHAEYARESAHDAGAAWLSRVRNPSLSRGERVRLFAFPVLLLGLATFGVLWATAGERSFPRDAASEPASAVHQLVSAITPEARMSPEMASQFSVLLKGDQRAQRRKAAAWFLLPKQRAAAPEVAVAVAELEVARKCTAQREALRRLVELDDERALPAVERLHRSERRGCGFLGFRDCAGCMRQELPEAVESLGGDPTKP
jgi:tRNA A-37 threonylcarbamoyl transferase component Bud32